MPARKSSSCMAAPKTKPQDKADSGDGLDLAPLRLYGKHAVMAALRNQNRDIQHLFMTAETAADLNESLHKSDIGLGKLPLTIIKRPELDRLLGSKTVHQGILLETRPLPNPDWRQARRIWHHRDRACLVVLDQVSDPHHLGSVLRSAAVFGALGVIIQDRHSPPESGALAKAASGALDMIPLFRVTNLVRALDGLRDDGFWCIGLAPESDQDIATTNGYQKSALVIGAEGRGLRRLTRTRCDILARLTPNKMLNRPKMLDSLSVATAAAVALYAVHQP